jgi:putative transposase
MARLTHRTVPGWTYFVTSKAWQNVSVFQVTEIAEIIVGKIFEHRDRGAYLLHQFVLMPNHLDLLLAPSGTTSLEKAVQLIKGGSSHQIHLVRKNKIQIWQSGFHESRVTDSSDDKNKSEYIHFKPVVANLVGLPEEWPFSSASPNYKLDPIPQGLKPFAVHASSVGPEGPTPNFSSISGCA